jgi:hypothetical protein
MGYRFIHTQRVQQLVLGFLEGCVNSAHLDSHGALPRRDAQWNHWSPHNQNYWPRLGVLRPSNNADGEAIASVSRESPQAAIPRAEPQISEARGHPAEP